MPRSATPVREGLTVGLLAYACVAVFYSAFDLLAARGPLFTVNLLGLAVFRGLRDPTVLRLPIDLDPNVIFAYNAVHLAASLIIGLIVARLVWRSMALRSEARAIYAFIIAGGIATVLLVGYLTAGMRPLVPYWSIVFANVLASIVAGWYMVRAHPGLLANVKWAFGLGRAPAESAPPPVAAPSAGATEAVTRKPGSAAPSR